MPRCSILIGGMFLVLISIGSIHSQTQEQQQLYQTTTTCILLTKQFISLSFDKITTIFQNNENLQQGNIIQKLQGKALLDCIRSFKIEDAEKLVQTKQDNILVEDIAIFFPNFSFEFFEKSDADFELTEQEARVLYVQKQLDEMLNKQAPPKQSLIQFIFSSKLNTTVISLIIALLIKIILLTLKMKKQNNQLFNLAKGAKQKQDKPEKQDKQQKQENQQLPQKNKANKKND
eukprot:TRINITY_DN261_c0_g1_i3.p1 TRINITY_DN261_c0_g1~~TRINITY_DN261_c0_g1_i3.p1  ORF type:complete len:232 (+),score=50.43 TRINITY_DN261_c0_g1_i3:184-879(+)